MTTTRIGKKICLKFEYLSVEIRRSSTFWRLGSHSDPIYRFNYLGQSSLKNHAEMDVYHKNKAGDDLINQRGH